MGVCWWCYWGWPEQIASIFDDAVRELDGDVEPLIHGPAHIVWEDENWDAVRLCLGDLHDNGHANLTEREIGIIGESLTRLLRVPDRYKRVPSGYDGENPADFPPPEDWKMVHR